MARSKLEKTRQRCFAPPDVPERLPQEVQPRGALRQRWLGGESRCPARCRASGGCVPPAPGPPPSRQLCGAAARGRQPADGNDALAPRGGPAAGPKMAPGRARTGAGAAREEIRGPPRSLGDGDAEPGHHGGGGGGGRQPAGTGTAPHRGSRRPGPSRCLLARRAGCEALRWGSPPFPKWSSLALPPSRFLFLFFALLIEFYFKCLH